MLEPPRRRASHASRFFSAASIHAVRRSAKLAETGPHVAVLPAGARIYVSGQAELFATNSLIIPDLQKRSPDKEFELKFTIRRSPAHMGVRMGEHNLVRWLDSFIFFNMMNGEIDQLHQKYLGMKLAPLPSL